MILLSLASRQIWPQVLTVAHFKPARVIFLHSGNPQESKGPAQRLKRLFDDTELVPKGGTRLELISDTDFAAIEDRLDSIQTGHALPLSDCALHFTGGNKLMATAAFRWAAKRGVQAFYLERRNQLTLFRPQDGEMITRTAQLDGHLTDELDPVALLRCQSDTSELERPGQELILNKTGIALSEADFFRRILNGNDPRPWLHINGDGDKDSKEGDALEFATAATLLKLGVKRVRRSLRLKAKSSGQTGKRHPHAEIDLVFTWSGRLWLVDCKDKMAIEDLEAKLRRVLPRPLSTSADELLKRIREELLIKQSKLLKEDLATIHDFGGLLGNVVCVRKTNLPEEVVQFANLNGIAMVDKAELVDALRRLLFPDQCPSQSDLDSLAKRFRT